MVVIRGEPAFKGGMTLVGLTIMIEMNDDDVVLDNDDDDRPGSLWCR